MKKTKHNNSVRTAIAILSLTMPAVAGASFGNVGIECPQTSATSTPTHPQPFHFGNTGIE